MMPVLKEAKVDLLSGANSNNLAASTLSRHPVDDLQRKLHANPFEDLQAVRHIYGTGLAMRLATERKIAAQEENEAGLPSAGLYRDIVTGNDTRIDFKDFLSLPEHRPDATVESPHMRLEHKLGM